MTARWLRAAAVSAGRHRRGWLRHQTGRGRAGDPGLDGLLQVGPQVAALVQAGLMGREATGNEYRSVLTVTWQSWPRDALDHVPGARGLGHLRVGRQIRQLQALRRPRIQHRAGSPRSGRPPSHRPAFKVLR